MTVIEIRPHRWGWKVFETPGVELYSRRKRRAISYARCRGNFRSGEIRLLASVLRLLRLYKAQTSTMLLSR
jgi:hypothetical protein